jgi:hypothetical protein
MSNGKLCTSVAATTRTSVGRSGQTVDSRWIVCCANNSGRLGQSGGGFVSLGRDVEFGYFRHFG